MSASDGPRSQFTTQPLCIYVENLRAGRQPCFMDNTAEHSNEAPFSV
jgi:hypothetical protein